MPNRIIEDFNGTKEISSEAYDLFYNGTLRVGEINAETVNEIVDEMRFLQSRNQPIKMIVNSPGGVVSAGLTIVDMIEGATVPVDVYVAGTAASMAAVILAAAPKSRRHILRSSTVLIHEPRISGMGVTTATEMEEHSKSISKIRDLTSGILARGTGHTVTEINELIQGGDKIFTAEEAVAFGICDDIVTTIP